MPVIPEEPEQLNLSQLLHTVVGMLASYVSTKFYVPPIITPVIITAGGFRKLKIIIAISSM